MSTAEDAIRAGAKAPADRLGKTPRRVQVGIYLDETLAEAYEQTLADLQQLQQRHQQEYPRRAAHAAALARDAGEAESTALDRLGQELTDELGTAQEQVAKALAALDEG